MLGNDDALYFNLRDLLRNETSSQSVCLLPQYGLSHVLRKLGNCSSSPHRSQARWSAISAEPSLLLFMFLPALIYESSMACDYFAFSNHAIGAIILAVPGMVLQVFLIAVCTK
jgi:hypothetical protein